MDSSWEVDIAKFMDENNIKWERSRKFVFLWTDINLKRRRYYPDFYLPDYDVYLDPKNKYLIIKDRFKINQVINEHKINLVVGIKDYIIEYLNKMVA